MKTLRLAPDYILVSTDTSSDMSQTKAGIFVPTNTGQQSGDCIIGTVVKTGFNDFESDFFPTPGEVVRFQRMFGIDVEIDSKSYKLVKIDNILSIEPSK